MPAVVVPCGIPKWSCQYVLQGSASAGPDVVIRWARSDGAGCGERAMAPRVTLGRSAVSNIMIKQFILAAMRTRYTE
jgi:hypothetical protein